MEGEGVVIHKGETFYAPERELYILQSGALHMEAMLWDEVGSTQSQVVGMLLPGDPVGILAKYITDVRFCYRATEDCFLQIMTDNFHLDTEGNSLTTLVFKALSEATLRLILSHSSVDIFREYPRIRALIYRYMEIKQSGELKEEKLLSFLLTQSSLPRKHVASILASLTDQAYLDVRRGKLNAINIPLPLEFRDEEMSNVQNLQCTKQAFRMVC
jgi:CRP-like cAMP-binding protein